MNIKGGVSFYKGKYLIGVYENDEWLIGLYDNTKDLAKDIGMNINTAYSTMSRLFNGKRDKLNINGKRYDVKFIELSDYDLEILNERGLR